MFLLGLFYSYSGYFMHMLQYLIVLWKAVWWHAQNQNSSASLY